MAKRFFAHETCLPRAFFWPINSSKGKKVVRAFFYQHFFVPNEGVGECKTKAPKIATLDPDAKCWKNHLTNPPPTLYQETNKGKQKEKSFNFRPVYCEHINLQYILPFILPFISKMSVWYLAPFLDLLIGPFFNASRWPSWRSTRSGPGPPGCRRWRCWRPRRRGSSGPANGHRATGLW